jgi:hypothetical protein
MSHIILDLDLTLVDTSRVEAYRSTNPGREYLQQNLGRLDTRLYDANCVRWVAQLNRRGKVSILTNSSPAFATAVLQKHGFPRDLPIYGAASKPDTYALRRLMREQRVSPDQCLMVGDKALDILTAHEVRIASIGVDWGGYNTEEQLDKAEPFCTVSSLDDLFTVVDLFESGQFEYEERDLSSYRMLRSVSQIEPKVQVVSLGDYTPYGRDSFSGHSSRILRFKQAKDYTVEEINDLAKNVYFAGGCLREDVSFRDVIIGFVPNLQHALANLDPADTLVLAAPNSLPEFCYKTDIPRTMVRTAFRKSLRLTTQRGIKRALPKLEAHNHGRTTEREHLATMGWNNNLLFPAVRNVVIFDDIWTSGTQIKTMVKMLREWGVGRNYYALVLGKTA